jgi:hypothetical protein
MLTIVFIHFECLLYHLGQTINLITDVSKLVNSSEPQQRSQAQEPQEAVLMTVLSIREKEISHVPFVMFQRGAKKVFVFSSNKVNKFAELRYFLI